MNKKINFIFLGVLSITRLALGLNNFQPKSEWISFTVSVPPAGFYVSDVSGLRAGANPTLSFDANGQQGDGLHGLEEIPGSVADQENIQNDITGGPSKHTTWCVKIPDGGAKNYTVNFIGYVNGISNLYVDFGIAGRPKSVQRSKTQFLVSSGFNRKFTVSYNPDSSRGLVVFPIIGDSGLLNDIKTACHMRLIKSSKVCEYLTKETEEIQKALDNKHYKKGQGLIFSFLYSLGDSRPKGCQDEDDHLFVKEPALTILKEDAKALLVDTGNRLSKH